MKLKVCGLKHPKNIREVAEQHPDFMGFIFYNKSSRFIDNIDLTAVLAEISPAIIKTGVFVNEEESNIKDLIIAYGLGAVQFHGNETPEFCGNFKKTALKVIKAFGIREASDFNDIKKYEGSCDYFLFDTKTQKYGGSGESFDWELLEFYTGQTDFLLSGGIGFDDLEEIQKISHSRFVGIDVNSGFEIEVALKDIELIKRLTLALNRD